MASLLANSISTTAREKAVEKVMAERWAGLDVDVIRRAQDPYECPVHLLPWLAHNRGVDLWRDTWSESRKRFAIKDIRRLRRLKGTVAAIRGYLALVDIALVSVVRPPQGIYLGGEVDPDVREAWLDRLPQLRIYPYRERPVTNETFLDVDHVDALVAGFDVATVSRGYQAVIWDEGVETALETISVAVRETASQIIETIRVPLNPGDVAGWFCLDVSHFDGSDVPAPEKWFAQVAAIDVVHDFVSRAAEPSVDFVTVNPARAVERRLVRVRADSPRPPRATYLDADHADALLLDADRIGEHVYDFVHLLFPSYPEPQPNTGMPVEEKWTMMPHPYAIIRIDARRPASKKALILDRAAEGFLDDDRLDVLADALEAVRCAEGGTDVIIIDSKIERTIRMSDGVRLSQARRMGAQIERT